MGACAAALLVACSPQAPEASTPASGDVVLLEVAARPNTALADTACRHGIFSAIDRPAVAAALAASPAAAGSTYQPAFSMSPPSISSFDPSYRHLPVGDGRGDVEAAQRALADCGHARGLTVRLAFAPQDAAVAEVIRVSLDRAGVTVEPSGAERADLTLRTYRPDRPGVVGFWQPLAHAVKLPAVDLLLASPEATSDDVGMQADLGRMIDRLVLESGHFIPLAHRTS